MTPRGKTWKVAGSTFKVIHYPLSGYVVREVIRDGRLTWLKTPKGMHSGYASRQEAWEALCAYASTLDDKEKVTP